MVGIVVCQPCRWFWIVEHLTVTHLPRPPKLHDLLTPGRRSDEALDLLSCRRSTLAKDLGEPGPSEFELTTLLRLSSRVPDHGKLGPWRFIVFEGQSRYRFGLELARIFRAIEPAVDEQRILFERNRLMRAPTVVCVISRAIENHKIPAWEQQLSAGAVCQTMLISAQAMGYAAQWLTEWYSYNSDVDEVLGLNDDERVAGFIYLGTATNEVRERRRANWEERVLRF